MIKLKIKLSLEMKHHVDSVRGTVTLKIVLVFQVQYTTLRYNGVNFLKTFQLTLGTLHTLVSSSTEDSWGNLWKTGLWSNLSGPKLCMQTEKEQ